MSKMTPLIVAALIALALAGLAHAAALADAWDAEDDTGLGERPIPTSCADAETDHEVESLCSPEEP